MKTRNKEIAPDLLDRCISVWLHRENLPKKLKNVGWLLSEPAQSAKGFYFS